VRGVVKGGHASLHHLRSDLDIVRFFAPACRAHINIPNLLCQVPKSRKMSIIIEAYEQYRMAVADDEDCKATTRFQETKCFSGYERDFLVPLFE